VINIFFAKTASITIPTNSICLKYGLILDYLDILCHNEEVSIILFPSITLLFSLGVALLDFWEGDIFWFGCG
jgi:hypothetical protein